MEYIMYNRMKTKNSKPVNVQAKRQKHQCLVKSYTHNLDRLKVRTHILLHGQKLYFHETSFYPDKSN